MSKTQFEEIYDELTSRQRQVLQGLLAGRTDSEIANSLNLEPSTIRRHLANIGKEFGLSNLEGEHYSYREELVQLVARYRPQLVNSKWTHARKSIGTLEFPGGPLSTDSSFYMNRPPIEERCTRELRKPGALIRIRAPRQMGKTSLLHRLANDATTLGYRIVRLPLRCIEERFLSDFDTFARWFCLQLSHKLGIAPQLEDYWDAVRFGSAVSCTTYLQAHLLAHLETPLLLALDDVDSLFEVPAVRQDFFGLLRSWHEEANSLESWQRLRLVVAHATEVYIPLNLHHSPFNVGLPVRLPDLTVAQVQQMAAIYGLDWVSDETARLMCVVGGHPYLVQLALYHLQQADLVLAELLETASTQAGIYAGHLRNHWQLVHQHPELLEALSEVLSAGISGISLDPIMAYKLESMGLIHLHGNAAMVRCDLYRRFFCDGLRISGRG